MIATLLDQGMSKTAIAKKLHVDRETVRNFIKWNMKAVKSELG